MHIYLLAYLAILAVWPHRDARFWLPVLPLLAMVVVQAIEPLENPTAKRLGVAYLCIYGLMAVVAFVYSTRLTYAGSRFPALYGDGAYRQSYEKHWAGKANDPHDTVAELVRNFGMISAPKNAPSADSSASTPMSDSHF